MYCSLRTKDARQRRAGHRKTGQRETQIAIHGREGHRTWCSCRSILPLPSPTGPSWPPRGGRTWPPRCCNLLRSRRSATSPEGGPSLPLLPVCNLPRATRPFHLPVRPGGAWLHADRAGPRWSRDPRTSPRHYRSRAAWRTTFAAELRNAELGKQYTRERGHDVALRWCRHHWPSPATTPLYTVWSADFYEMRTTRLTQPATGRAGRK